MSFIDKFLEHTKEYESPKSFWLWAAISTIAGALRDNVYSQYGESKLYPNLYVLFLADSGSRKDDPIKLSENILSEVGNTKIISGRSSIQGILDELARSETDAKSGKLLKGGSATFFAPELASGIVSDDAAVSILTDIYGGKVNFKSILRTAPTFRIERIVFNALMASNEEMLKTIYDIRAKRGGLLARTMLVFPDEFRPPNSLWSDIEKEKERKLRYRNLVNLLSNISELRGEIVFSEDAKNEFDKWYYPFRLSTQKKVDKIGILGRIHTSIRKLAMIIAANFMRIEVKKEDMVYAIDESLKLLPNYETLVMSSGGKSDLSSIGAIIITELASAENYSLSKRDILNKHWQDIGSIEILEKILATLEAGGIIKISSSGRDLIYQLSKKTLEKLGKI